MNEEDAIQNCSDEYWNWLKLFKGLKQSGESTYCLQSTGLAQPTNICDLNNLQRAIDTVHEIVNHEIDLAKADEWVQNSSLVNFLKAKELCDWMQNYLNEHPTEAQTTTAWDKLSDKGKKIAIGRLFK